MVHAFDEDSSNPNPYAMPETKKISQAEVRKSFAAQDKKEVDAGTSCIHDVSGRGFMIQAIDLEESQ